MSYIGKTTVSGSGQGTVNTDLYVIGGVYSNGTLLGSGGGASNTFWGDVSFNNGSVYIGGTAKFSPSLINNPQYYFPQGAMTALVQSGFTASASSTFATYYAYKAFDSVESVSNLWISQASTAVGGSYDRYPYTAGTGVYQGATNQGANNVITTTVSSVVTNGEWLQIQCPSSIGATSFYIAPSTAFSTIAGGKIAGSNNGTTWTLLATISTNINFGTTITSSGGAYTYYRLIITNLDATSTYMFGAVAEFSVYSSGTNTQLTGVQSIAGVSGTLALVGNLTVPTTSTATVGAAIFSQALNYYPQTYYLMTSASGTSSINGVTYTASAGSYANGSEPYKAFNGNSSDSWYSNNSQFGTFNQNPYNSTTGAYQGASGSNLSTNGVAGEWLQIQSSSSIVATSFSYAGFAAINQGYVYGSNDGSTWTNCGLTNSFPTTNGAPSVIMNTVNLTPYTYYRLVINSLSITSGTGSTSFYPSVSEFSVNSTASATSLSGLTNVSAITMSPSYTTLPNYTGSNVGYSYTGYLGGNLPTSPTTLYSFSVGAGVYLVELSINTGAFSAANSSFTISIGSTPNTINLYAQSVNYTTTTSQSLSARVTTVYTLKNSGQCFLCANCSVASIPINSGSYTYTRIA